VVVVDFEVFLRRVFRLLVTANVLAISPFLVTLMTEAICSSATWFLQEPHGVTSQKTVFLCLNELRENKFSVVLSGIKPWPSRPLHVPLRARCMNV
jgi:hypothetical protein